MTGDRALCLTYLRYELRHRWRQALCTAGGLAVGVGLVSVVSAASAGARNAQSSARLAGTPDHRPGPRRGRHGRDRRHAGRRRSRLRRHRPGRRPGPDPDRQRPRASQQHRAAEPHGRGSHAPLGNDGLVAVPVHFSAPISPRIVALAVALGILGALLAGALGAWRAARLSPAAALTKTS